MRQKNYPTEICPECGDDVDVMDFRNGVCVDCWMKARGAGRHGDNHPFPPA